MTKKHCLTLLITVAFAFQASELVKITMSGLGSAPDCPIVGVLHKADPVAQSGTRCCPTVQEACESTRPTDDGEPTSPGKPPVGNRDNCSNCRMLAVGQFFVLQHTAETLTVLTSVPAPSGPRDLALRNHTFSPLHGRAPPA